VFVEWRMLRAIFVLDMPSADIVIDIVGRGVSPAVQVEKTGAVA
jgi:hypothetical protein